MPDITGAAYRLIFHTAAGVKTAELLNFRSLTVTKKVNMPGRVAFSLNGSESKISLLAADSQVEVWRRSMRFGIPWYRLHTGIFRDFEIKGDDSDVYGAECPGIMSMLDRRVVAWKGNTANRTRFDSVAAETIAKNLVKYNNTSLATVLNGRLREGAMTSPWTVTVQTDAAAGNVLSQEFVGDKLLVALGKIAGQRGGGDFDLVKTGPAAFEFRWYSPHLGTDRSATVVFAHEYNNMSNPSYRLRRSGESTVAIIGGQGQDASRTFTFRTGNGFSATNDIETFVSGSGERGTAFLNVAGDRKLDEVKARGEIDFTVKQSVSTQIDRDYFLGDLVTARYRTFEGVKKITGVTFQVSEDGSEKINVETADV